MAILRSGAPSMRRAERSSARATSPAGGDPATSGVKKKIDSAAAWREFRVQINACNTFYMAG